MWYNELQVMENDFLGIDEVTEIVIFNNNIVLLNHISLHMFSNLTDKGNQVVYT